MTEATTLHKALYTINKLKHLLKTQKSNSYQPIAIIGVSCRFPQVANKDDYWQLLTHGKNVITHIPEERWQLLEGTDEITKREKDHPYWGGFLSNISAFDAYFFGITPREAVRMDPQQRLLLEVTYEAIEDAGLTTEALAGSNTGVFASLYPSQLGHLQKLETEMDALYLPTGNATSIAANRISYQFDLRGPSLVVDTACSSSLVALHLACLNIQNNSCDLSLVGGISLNLLPSINLTLSKAKMLSQDGQCKTFDAQANGYVQGEGVGVIVLKPLAKAIEDKDRIYAVIAGSGINQDGRTNGLTAPNGLQQEKLLRDVYNAAGIDPLMLSYVECHGTGTFLGDPIEIQALGNIISKNRKPENPCWIGSVKTNLGHLEPAAGMSSIIKIALALKNAQIPPHLNFINQNPHIPFNKYNLKIPKNTIGWPKHNDQRIAGISSFGFGGTNAHVIVRDLTEQEKLASISLSTAPIESTNNELFTLSAKDPVALNQLILLWRNYLKNNLTVNLAQLCFNTHLRRAHFSHKVAIISSSIAELYNLLCAIIENPSEIPVNVFTKTNCNDPNLLIEYKNIAHMPLNSLDLKIIAKLYVQNSPINWIKFEERRSYPYIEMPSYPWQPKSYWPNLNSSHTTVSAQTGSYPLQGKQIISPVSLLQFEFIFNINQLPELKDTYNILHAGYFIEMLAFVVNNLYQQHTFNVEELTFLSPILVPNNNTIRIHLILEQLGNDLLSCIFYSQPIDKNNWVKNSTCKLTLSIIKYDLPILIDEIKKRAISSHDAEKLYNRIASMEMPAGESIRWTHQYWLEEKVMVCEFKTPASVVNDKFKLNVHPGIIDGCIQPLFMLLPEQLNQPYVASTIGKFLYSGITDQSLSLLTILKEISPNGERIIGDWYLIDNNNHIVAVCKDMHMARLNNKISLEQIMHINTQHDFNLDSIPPEHRQGKITDYLVEKIAAIFSMPSNDINTHQSLREIGIDSLMALSFTKIIETNLGVSYSVENLLQGPTIAEITDFILTQKQLNLQPSTHTFDSKENTKNGNSWIAYRKTQPNAKVRLFCFPYGGAGASIYNNWQRSLPETIEICPIQLPGRENRMNEQITTDIALLINNLAEHLKNEFNLPFAFFGHSFGALIAFELIRYLRKCQLPLPIQFFASAFPDPRAPTRSLNNLLQQLKTNNLNILELDNADTISLLNDKQLTQLASIFNEHNDINYDPAMNKELFKILLPILIADMRLVKNYQFTEDTPLEVPITVFSGKHDSRVSYNDMAGWVTHTKTEYQTYELNGGHLFIRDDQNRQEIFQKIKQALAHHLLPNGVNI